MVRRHRTIKKKIRSDKCRSLYPNVDIKNKCADDLVRYLLDLVVTHRKVQANKYAYLRRSQTS